MIKYRLKAILEMIYTHPTYDQYIDVNLVNKILNKYMENYN